MSIIGNNNIGVYSALTAVKPESGEEPVQILWNTICSSIFPPAEGYKFSVQGAVLMDDTVPDVVVFEIKQNGVIDTVQKTGSIGLREHQIMDRMQGTIEGYPWRVATPAIGSKVRFFQWSRPRLSLLHAAPFELFFEAERAQAEQVLLYIKQRKGLINADCSSYKPLVRSTTGISSPYASGVGFLSEQGHITASDDYDVSYTDRAPAYESYGLLYRSGSFWAFPIHDVCWHMIRQSTSNLADTPNSVIARHLFYLLLCTPCNDRHQFSPGHDFGGAAQFQGRIADSLHLPRSNVYYYINCDPSTLEDTASALNAKETVYPGAKRLEYPQNTHTEHTRFERLPVEIIHLIFELLSTSDVRNIRLVSRRLADVAMVEELPQSFWRSRFYPDQEMGFTSVLLPHYSTLRETSWKDKYISFQAALRIPNRFPSTRNRQRIWSLARPLSGLIEAIIQNDQSKKTRTTSDDFSPSAMDHVPSHIQAGRVLQSEISRAPYDRVLEFGCRELSLRSIRWQTLTGFRSYQLGISVASFYRDKYISGLRIIPQDDQQPLALGLSIGLIDKTSESIIEVTSPDVLEGFDVAVKESGICGLRPRFRNATLPAEFVGNCGNGAADIAFGQLLFQEGKEYVLFGGFDVCKMVSLGLMEIQQSLASNLNPHQPVFISPEAFTQEMLWTPTAPKNVSLQLGSLAIQQTFRRSLNANFGGDDGSLISSLTRIVFSQDDFRAPIVGLEFCYADSSSRLYGRRGRVEQSFLIDGPGGEFIVEVRVGSESSDIETENRTLIRSLEMITNIGSRMICNAAAPNKIEAGALEHLSAPSGQVIVGFIAGMGVPNTPFVTFGIQTTTISRNLESSEIKLGSTPPNESMPTTPDVGSRVIRTKGIGTIHTEASLRDVRSIRFSCGNEGRPRGVLNISGMWIEYQQPCRAQIVGQWILECGSLHFLEGEKITEICVWMSKDRVSSEGRTSLGRVVGIQITSSSQRLMALGQQTSLKTMILRFRENPLGTLDSIIWDFNPDWDHLRIVGSRSGLKSQIELWPLPPQPSWIVYDKIFWSNTAKHAVDDLANVQIYGDNGIILGICFKYASGATASLGRTDTTCRLGSFEARRTQLVALEIGWENMKGVKEIIFQVERLEDEKHGGDPAGSEMIARARITYPFRTYLPGESVAKCRWWYDLSGKRPVFRTLGIK
ncbi:hypothetical protein FQN53_009135 [Emmonsiellopsis sp. PD_33]|nr:hypothetical protein FQN53_009135 [Emmonsiellopsis sp. PD_33]